VLQAEEGLEKSAWARALCLSQYSDMGEFLKIEFSGKEPSENEESDVLYKALENGNNSAVFIENMSKLSEDEKSNIRQRLMIFAKKNTGKVFIGVSEKEESFFMDEETFVEFNIPPLRSSLEEIPQILDETVKFFVEKDGHGYRRFSLASQNMLSKYQWPGNLRQLVDLVQGLLSRREKEIANVDEIQEIITLQGPGGNILIENNILSLSMKEAKKLFERAYLTRQLELVGGKISELSRRVDMERTNLYRKLQSLDIEYKKKKKTTS